MAGILNSKHRIMDVIITDEGRRQASMGELSIKYATFTDRHTFYDSNIDNPNIAADASSRLYFECTGRQQDQIVVETTDVGVIKPFRTSDFDIGGTTIVSGSLSSVIGVKSYELTGSQYVAISDDLLNDITNNYLDQQIIGTSDLFADSSEFVLNQNKHTFKITREYPLPTNNIISASLNNIESLFQDRRLSHLPNFKYLPPTNKPKLGEIVGSQLGNYVNWSQKPPMSYQDIMDSLETKEYVDIEFIDTSRENNLMMQIFEFSEDDIRKLAIIDFGEFPDADPFNPSKRIFFIGKLYNDSYGAPTFVNIFTIIME